MTNKILKFLLSTRDSSLFLDEAALSAVGCEGVNGICTDYSGNIYVSDSLKHAIFKVTESGKISLFAGQVGVFGNNGSNTVKATEAKFNAPTGLTMDKSGNIYVADTGNNQIRKIDYNGKTGLLAGDPAGESGYSDNGFLTSKFHAPRDVFADNSGNVFVADTFNHCIRLISSRKNAVLTIAGNGTPGDATGLGATARFNRPSAIIGDVDGYAYIADSQNFKIKTLFPDGRVYHFSGSGVAGNAVGNAATAQYQEIRFMSSEKTGNIFVVDVDSDEINDSRLLRIDSNGTSSVVASINGADKGLIAGVGATPGEKLFVTQSESAKFNAKFIFFKSGESYIIDDEGGAISTFTIKYEGEEDTTCTMEIESTVVVIGDVGGNFVFDIGGGQEHTFTTENETKSFTFGAKEIVIKYKGTGCHLFEMKNHDEFFVAKTGSDETGDGTESNPYLTISKAISVVPENKTIIVAPGLYDERITIPEAKSGIQLRGAQYGVDARNRVGVGESIISADWTVVHEQAGVWIKANNITIDGFTIPHGDHFWKQIKPDGNNTTFNNNIISRQIYISKDISDLTFKNNWIKDTKIGESITQSINSEKSITNLVVEDNLFTNIAVGVHMAGGSPSADYLNTSIVRNDFNGVAWMTITLAGNRHENLVIEHNNVDNGYRLILSMVTSTKVNGASIKYNTISNANNGVDVREISEWQNVDIQYNNFNVSNFGIKNHENNNFVVYATHNWWGTTVESEIETLMIGDVVFTPWLNAPFKA
jgi:hypothetical protein